MGEVITDKIREQSQWRKGKTPIIGKFLEDHAKLMSEVAGRGFLNLPGYAFDAENNLELAAKMGLSDLNFKILSETVERELKQQGIAYDLSYRDAALQWEIEKQNLVNAWAAEYAGIKQGMATQEEVLNMMMAAIGEREVVLTTSKTAIALQMEAYRTELSQLDADLAPYEVSLAQAKMLTAQKKLDIIPILQEIVVQEQQLLVVEQQKAAATTSLANAQQEVVTKTQLLVPGLQQLANESEILANDIPSEVATMQEIANEKLAQSGIATQKADYGVQELEADISAENVRLEIKTAERGLEVQKFDDTQTLLEKEIADKTVYQQDVMAGFTTVIAMEKAVDDLSIANKKEVNDTTNATKLTSITTIDSAEAGAMQAKTSAGIYEVEQKADIDSVSKITASLTHLIG